MRRQRACPRLRKTSPLPRLLLAGSCSAMTQRQVGAYLAWGGASVRIEPDELLSGRQTEQSLRQAIQAARGDLLLYSTAAPELWPISQPNLRLVLKSGNFGDEDFFLTALTR